MDYHELIHEARLHYGREKPEFARVTGTTKPGHLREVVLPTAAGNYPATSKEIELGVLTAVRWDNRHFFWSLDDHGKHAIVSCSKGSRAPYKPWLGVGKGFGDQPVAFGGLNPCIAIGLEDKSDTTEVSSSDKTSSEEQHPSLNENPFNFINSSSRKRTKKLVTTGPSQKRARVVVEVDEDTETQQEAEGGQLERRQQRPTTTALETTQASFNHPVQPYKPKNSRVTISGPKGSHEAIPTNLTSRERILMEKLKILDQLLQIEEQKSNTED